jgi:amidase
MKIGIDRRYAATNTDAHFVEALEDATRVLARLGGHIVDIDLTGLDEVCRYWMLTCGVDTLLHHGKYYPARAGDYGAAFRSLLDYAVNATAADYARGEILRQSTVAIVDRALTGVDVFLMPAAPTLPMDHTKVSPHGSFPVEGLHPFFRHTAPLNYSGHPSITLPNGFAPQGLPVAMQIVGPHGAEAAIIRAAAAYEAATDWHKRRPPL